MPKQQSASKDAIKITTELVVKVTMTQKMEIVEANKKAACNCCDQCKR